MPHWQSELFSLKSIPAKIINLCQFVTDPLKSLNIFSIKVKPSGQPDFSFENESTMCMVIAVMIDNFECMKAVTSQTGCSILQNSY